MTPLALSHHVTDFLWEAGEAVPVEDLVREGATMGRLAAAHGQFALHEEDADGHHTLVRDELGVNKLFFTIGDDGAVASSNYLHDLIGADAGTVWSVPAGHTVRIAPADRLLTLTRWSTLHFGPESPLTPAQHAVRIRTRLIEVFREIRAAVAGRPLYVTLSGGLDSTTIAVLAREFIGEFTAVTFVLDPKAGPGSSGDEAPAEPGSDLFHARHVAQILGVPSLVVRLGGDAVLALLDDTLIHGQDFRDFNVHCGLVNSAIAAALHARHPDGPRPVVLTGDTMNELLADYTPELHRGAVVYPLPRLARGRLRRHLVRGLDAGDREIGIFNQRGLDTIQPYALCASAYAALPDAAVESPDAKAVLVRAVMGRQVPEFVYARPKVRAQVGGASDGGTMALLLDRGIDGAWLEARFATLFGMEDPAEVRRGIRAGRYRFPVRYPSGAHCGADRGADA